MGPGHRPTGEPLATGTGWRTTGAATVIDGRPHAVTGGNDKAVRLWDLTTGRPAGRELRFPSPVRSVAVSPDDDRSGRIVVGFGHEVAAVSRT